MKIFGVFFNPVRADDQHIRTILATYRHKQVNFVCLPEQEHILPDYVTAWDGHQSIDVILVFGGDGTMLRAVPFSLKAGAPLLGVNLGKLGFLSESHPKNIGSVIESLLQGKYRVEERMLLKLSLKRQGKIIHKSMVLNDAVVYKGIVPKLIEIKLYANQRFVLETRCDGMVVSTPTGSTAYSLAAGGPILSPIMEAVVVAPLNPHILTVRPMVFPAKAGLLLKILNTLGQTQLQGDGDNLCTLEDGDELYITRASRKVKFIKLSNRTFYQILRRKLHMGQQ